MGTVNTEDFATLLVAILSALPPDSSICSIVQRLAQSEPQADYDNGNLWGDDKEQLIAELTREFGYQIEFEAVIEKWFSSI
ncbi:MAG: hypothetical protein KA717_31850 [Woronichinia naegeliana WA131]|jgi:hypothetical protein|uniref:Uncharacterized protein n=1 Tax=Woronichinia naegeliana WA131 TaxID=2824559 RepID=A0A977KUL4_9CYAN|nr:MAG: hypothetical protein KA717_31850 [Woronichinia naegeliana WA131]